MEGKPATLRSHCLIYLWILKLEAGEMAQRLRVLAALTEDQSHSDSSSSRSDILSSPSLLRTHLLLNIHIK